MGQRIEWGQENAFHKDLYSHLRWGPSIYLKKK